jgi:hypothetical protein
MSFSSWCSLFRHWCVWNTLIIRKLLLIFIIGRETTCRSFCITRNVTQKVRSRRDGRDPPDPQKPRFWACQKVVPPPCKNVQKMGFLGEKACIFGQFVHNFAQKWPLFCGHSPPLQGCQSVGKKPANLYSTKCRIFGPRTPPPVAPWWDTSSRRPPTGSRRPNRIFQ